MEVVTISSTPLGYSLCPTLYSVRLKTIDSPHKVVVMLQSDSRSLNITTWQDIRVQQPILQFKVVVFSNPAQTTYHTSHIKPMFTKVVVSPETSFTFETVEINKVKQSPSAQFYKLSLLPSTGYSSFLAFRKKVKKLQNITSYLDWKVSCRLRVIQNQQVVSLLEIDAKDGQEVVLNLDRGLVKFQLEEISWLNSPQNSMSSIISDNTVGITESSEITFQFSQYLTLKFKVEKLAASDTIHKGLMSIRILESVKHSPVKLTVKNPEPHVQVIQPLITQETAYFDLQYYYLQKNLEDTMSNSSRQSVSVSEFKVFQELRQLTPAFPNFPHIKNQILIPIDPASTISLSTQSLSKTLKVFQLMDGLNSIRLGEGYVRFFIQFSPEKDSPAENKLRMFRIKITDIWNIPQAIPLKLKILNNKNLFSLDLPTTKKQLKNLIYQNQFSKSSQITIKEQGKVTVITKSDKYVFTQLPQKQYYISQNYFNEEISISLASDEGILFAGLVKFKNLGEQTIVPLESMEKKNDVEYSFVKVECYEIPKHSNSVKSLYKLAYNLTCNTTSFYELRVINITNNQKQYKRKISTTKPDFFSDSDFFLISPSQQCQLQISIRKHYLDEISNQYLHFQLMNKKFSINNHSTTLLENSLRINPNEYELVSQNLTDGDEAIRFQLQITHIKEEFLDQQHYLYSFRIPKQFWQIIKESFRNINSITFEILSSKKQKKSKGIGARSKEINYMDSSEFVLAQTDYRDSLSIRINDVETGYSKMSDLVTARIEFPEKGIVFDEQGEWNLGVMNVSEKMLLFIYTFKQYHEGSSDADSVRTVSMNKSKGKSKNKSINLNKTMKIQNNIQLQQQINNLTQQNRLLITKAVRLQSNNTILHQKLQQLQNISKRSKMDLKFNQKSSSTPHKRNPNQSKNAEKYRSVCACGATQNLYIGYCEVCLKQLETTYGIVYKLFQTKAGEYQQTYFEKVLKKEKIQKMEKKLESLKQRLLFKQSMQDDEMGATTEESSYHEVIDRIASLKNEVFTMNLKTKSSIDSSSVLQQNLETKINSCNKNIFSMMQEIEDYKVRTRELDEMIKEYKSD